MEERRMKTDKTYWLVWGMILAIIILLLLIGYVFPPTSSVRIDDGWSFLDYVSLLYFKSASYIIILLSNVAVGLTLVLTVRYRLRLAVLAFVPLWLRSGFTYFYTSVRSFLIVSDDGDYMVRLLLPLVADFIWLASQPFLYYWISYLCRKKQKSVMRFFLIAAVLDAALAFFPIRASTFVQLLASLGGTDIEVFYHQLTMLVLGLLRYAVLGAVVFATAYLVHRWLYLHKKTIQPNNLNLE